jgi:hypothetical protein
MTGHVTERMTEHYSHVESDEKQQAASDVLRLVFPPPARSGTCGGLSLEAPNKKTS